jgi:hypothetical protein
MNYHVKKQGMSFNDYWKEKATKRRKSWAGKAQRFAQKHMQLEAIRSESVYSHMKRTEVRSLRDKHRTVQNPIARWDSNMHFSFSEQGLREAMQAEGADVSSLTMTISKKSIVGQQPHEITYGDIHDVAYNRRDLYAKYTDLETCTINYREVTMVIYRYTYLQQPFALYELVPCQQLSISDLRLEETSFSTLNIATFLMEMAAEYELRQEEFNYYAKKLKLRTMEAVTTNSIEFEPWDDKKLQKKVLEYIGKEYKLDKIIEQVIRPWKSAIKKYIDAIMEQSLRENNIERFEPFCNSYSRDKFVEERLHPNLESVGLQEVELEVSGKDNIEVMLKYQGAKSRLSAQFQNFFFYPNSYYDGCFFDLAENTPLSAVTDYLKMMPALNQRMDETILKALHIYDQQMQQNEKYHATVEQLEALAQQYAGKPVGKMMKYLRWEASQIFDSKPLSLGMRLLKVLMIPTIKIVSDSAFSFVEEKRLNGNTVSQEEEVIRWVDAECQNVFVFDPVTTDVETWVAANRQGAFTPTFKWKVGDFVRSFMPTDSKPFLSIDFIDQKL